MLSHKRVVLRCLLRGGKCCGVEH
ncbi:hypothetical protein [Bartonella gliris]